MTEEKKKEVRPTVYMTQDNIAIPGRHEDGIGIWGLVLEICGLVFGWETVITGITHPHI